MLKKLSTYTTFILVIFSASVFAQQSSDHSVSSNEYSSAYSFEIGSRLWYGLNKFHYDYYSTSSNYGNPAATLTYDNSPSYNLDVFGKITNNDSKLFAKGIITLGVAGAVNGSNRDVDFYPGQITYSNTLSSSTNNHNLLLALDFGKDYEVGDSKISPYFGYMYWRDSLTGYGGTVNPVGNNSFYNSNGYVVGQTLPNNMIDLAYDTRVMGLRLGLSFETPINDKFKLSFDIFGVPYADITMFDYHNYGSNRVVDGNPNGVSRGIGIGYGGDAFINYQINPSLEVGLGVRYMDFYLKNQDISFNIQGTGWVNNPSGLQYLEFQQLGFLTNFKYKF